MAASPLRPRLHALAVGCKASPCASGPITRTSLRGSYLASYAGPPLARGLSLEGKRVSTLWLSPGFVTGSGPCKGYQERSPRPIRSLTITGWSGDLPLPGRKEGGRQCRQRCSPRFPQSNAAAPRATQALARVGHWGKMGAFWGGLWSLLFGAAVLFIPGVGPVVAAGSVVTWLIAGLEGAVAVGGLSALGAALFSFGIPKDSIVKYETSVKAGKFVLIAHGTAEEVEKARGVLQTSGAEQINTHQQPTEATRAARQVSS
jgi:hypothetical protein